jgi:hypothetical protein
VHFLDAWIRLSPDELARLMLAPACVALATVLPGRRASALACLGLAVAVLIAPDPDALSASGFLASRIAWALLWLVLAGVLARSPADAFRDWSSHRGGIESGAVGLLLGLALLTLLVAALARADLDERISREASYGMLLIALGLLHLMLRRHVLRATLAFGALGLALDRLVRTAGEQQIPNDARPLAVWLATALAIALVARIARLRLAGGGGAWVGGAHDLHD